MAGSTSSRLDAFYEDNLYPLQNGVLQIVDKLGSHSI